VRLKTYLGTQRSSHLCLEQLDISFSIIPPLLKVRPTPDLVLVVNLLLDGSDRELPQCSVSVSIDLFLRRLIDSILALSSVEVEQIDHAERISVLICIENESEFVEEEFSVEFGDLRVCSFVDDESTSSRDGFQNELMFRGVILARDEIGELCDGFIDRVTGERGGIGVEVDGERVEGSEFVDGTGRVGDESRLPF